MRLLVSVVPLFHDSDLFLGQCIQLIHQRVNPSILGLDPALVEVLVGGNAGGQRLAAAGPTCGRRCSCKQLS